MLKIRLVSTLWFISIEHSRKSETPDWSTESSLNDHISILFICLFAITFILEKSFRSTTMLNRDFPYMPYLLTGIISFIVNILHQRSTFVTTNGNTLTYHYHIKSIVYIRVHCWCIFCDFIISCMYHYSIIQSSITA